MEPRPNETSPSRKRRRRKYTFCFVQKRLQSEVFTAVDVCLGCVTSCVCFVMDKRQGQLTSLDTGVNYPFLMSRCTSCPLRSRQNWIIIESLAAIMTTRPWLYSRTVSPWHGASHIHVACLCAFTATPRKMRNPFYPGGLISRLTPV